MGKRYKTSETTCQAISGALKQLMTQKPLERITVAEIMRGKTGRAYGNLINLLTTLKGIPLTYNRDLQEDKIPFLDTDRTVRDSLALMADMLQATAFNPARMRRALGAGFLNATELADYLATRGMLFREAHHVTGRAVALAEEKGTGLEALSRDELRSLSRRMEEDVYALLDLSPIYI